MKIGTTRVNEQIGHATAVAVIRDDNLLCLSLNQTADLAGAPFDKSVELQMSGSCCGVQRPMRASTLVADF